MKIDSFAEIVKEDVKEKLGNGYNGEGLREIIKEVNDTQLIEEEILSYSLYYYDAEIDEVRIYD